MRVGPRDLGHMVSLEQETHTQTRKGSNTRVHRLWDFLTCGCLLGGSWVVIRVPLTPLSRDLYGFYKGIGP